MDSEDILESIERHLPESYIYFTLTMTSFLLSVSFSQEYGRKIKVKSTKVEVILKYHQEFVGLLDSFLLFFLSSSSTDLKSYPVPGLKLFSITISFPSYSRLPAPSLTRVSFLRMVLHGNIRNLQVLKNKCLVGQKINEKMVNPYKRGQEKRETLQKRRMTCKRSSFTSSRS